MIKNNKKEKLFSYGSLQSEAVQLTTFARKLIGKSDTLSKYRLIDLKITDPDVLAKSGQAIHPIALYTGNNDDEVNGMVFDISKNELLKSDKYEVSDYKKVRVLLDSGIKA